MSADAKPFSPIMPSVIEPTTSRIESNEYADNSVSFKATSSTIASSFSGSKINKQVLLCTAVIKVKDAVRQFQFCRALLDSGSQASFVTEDCVSRLDLSRRKAKVFVSCLGSSETHTNGMLDLEFTSHYASDSSFRTSVCVIGKITGNLPHCFLDSSILKYYNDLTLADLTFYKSNPIDKLLGIDISLPIIQSDIMIKKKGMPFAVRSDLGWIIAGASDFNLDKTPHVSVHNMELNTDDLITKFWELETVKTANLLTKKEQACELHFQQTHYRDENGRYTVRLPFRALPSQLGDSRKYAERCLLSLEKKFQRQPELQEQYIKFMTEYEDLGHMEEILETSISNESIHKFYLPHRAVVKSSSTTTKLRVVFNASAKSSSSVSLNDILMVGPRIQEELFPILLRFRTHPIAIIADIEKMFRQVKVHYQDTDFQRVLWRANSKDPIKEYRLLTVTYGTASVPYLSTRSLKQLAIDEEKEFPLASKVICKDFYVNDLLTGAQTMNEAYELVRQLQEVMKKGCITLRKWSSNDSGILEIIPENLKEFNTPLQINADEMVRVLGLKWHPASDTFDFVVSTCLNSVPTKRTILSEIAKIFDPMGWLAPCVISAKIFLQELWKFELSWDEPICVELTERWIEFQKQLNRLSQVKIPRFVFTYKTSSIEIHGFCDSSEKGYCAVIYLRSVSLDHNINVSLLTAKTRVAPLKNISIARLELCSALLLTNLLDTVLKCIDISAKTIYTWTDSQIALAWISSEPRRWQTFVANRVAKIQETLPDAKWGYISGKENPAVLQEDLHHQNL